MLSVILNHEGQSSIYASTRVKQAASLRPQMLEAIWHSIHVQIEINLMRQRDGRERLGRDIIS